MTTDSPRSPSAVRVPAPPVAPHARHRAPDSDQDEFDTVAIPVAAAAYGRHAARTSPRLPVPSRALPAAPMIPPSADGVPHAAEPGDGQADARAATRGPQRWLARLAGPKKMQRRTAA
jgi:hypothetical protein